jgi:hypothetical protein
MSGSKRESFSASAKAIGRTIFRGFFGPLVIFLIYPVVLLIFLVTEPFFPGLFAVELARYCLFLRLRNVSEALAKRALKKAPRKWDALFSPSICHQAHVVLGRVALERGDYAAASSHLIASTAWAPIHFMDTSLAKKMWIQGYVADSLDFYEAIAQKSIYADWNEKTKRWVEESRSRAYFHEMDYRPPRRFF